MSNRAELNKLVYDYLLSCIDGEGYGISLTTDAEKLQFLADTFKKEYCYPENFKYYGSLVNVLKNWLMGLPSCYNVDFENYKILELAKSWGSLPIDATEKQEDKILNNWFNWMANKTIQLAKKHKIELGK